jgi:heme-degrading monooxygenase HmoA
MADADHYASGNWHVREGSEEDFLARWREFLEWTRGSAQGFQHAFLLQGRGDPRHFVSYSTWDEPASVQKWSALPEFEQKLGACRDLCENFESDAYERVLTIQ